MPNANGTSAIDLLSFGVELKAAGLAGLDCSPGADGSFTWGPSITDAQRAAVLAVYARHDPDPLGALTAELCARVDVRAEALRLTLITDGSGQAMEYQETYAQAVAALSDPANATAARYPMLAATIGIDRDPDTGNPASDVLGVARGVIKVSDAFQIFGAALKRARLQGKAAIKAAADTAGKRAAFDAIAWPA